MYLFSSLYHTVGRLRADRATFSQYFQTHLNFSMWLGSKRGSMFFEINTSHRFCVEFNNIVEGNRNLVAVGYRSHFGSRISRDYGYSSTCFIFIMKLCLLLYGMSSATLVRRSTEEEAEEVLQIT